MNKNRSGMVKKADGSQLKVRDKMVRKAPALVSGRVPIYGESA
jgi:hypothetical protein